MCLFYGGVERKVVMVEGEENGGCGGLFVGGVWWFNDGDEVVRGGGVSGCCWARLMIVKWYSDEEDKGLGVVFRRSWGSGRGLGAAEVAMNGGGESGR